MLLVCIIHLLNRWILFCRYHDFHRAKIVVFKHFEDVKYRCFEKLFFSLPYLRILIRYAISKSKVTPGTTRSMGRGFATGVILLIEFSFFFDNNVNLIFKIHRKERISNNNIVGPLFSACSQQTSILLLINLHKGQSSLPHLHGSPLFFGSFCAYPP
jgi:hypothetical protein